MDYVELTFTVPSADAERVADVVRAHTNGGVAIELPFTQRTLESDAELHADGRALVRAYLTTSSPMQRVIDEIGAGLARAGMSGTLDQRVVPEEDWAEAWKEHFHVERFGRIVVVPSWRAYVPEPSDVVVFLDPGMAFGTGQHETTRMCVEALDNTVRPGARMLDVGCGSGILAIAAAKLGAADVHAIDIDPECVRITRENVTANHVENVVHATLLAPGPHPFAHLSAAPFDVIAANIIASTIIELAADLAAALAPDGRIIASGIIADRVQETSAALSAAGLGIEQVRAMGEWRCIEAVTACLR